MELAEKLLSNYIPEPNSGCWLWTGGTNSYGYGRVCHHSKVMVASRAAYAVFRGAIPDGGSILHRCDTPSCINPDHLFVGTQADNMRDMAAKKRQRPRRGRQNPNAKLCEEAVRQIRAQRNEGLTYRAIAEFFGVTEQTVFAVMTKRLWGHVQ